MKTGRLPNAIKGTTLIFALIILAVSAMVLAGVVMVMGALVEHTVASQTAMTRRQTLENSRMLAMQFARGRALANNFTGGVANLSMTAGGYTVGGFTTAGSGVSAWTGTTRPAGPNPFSPGGDTRVSTNYYSGFSTLMSASLSSGTSTIPWNFEVRTRTPTLGYDLATYTAAGMNGNISSANAIGATNGSYFSGTLQNVANPPQIGLSASGSNMELFVTAIQSMNNIAVTGSATTPAYTVAGGTVTLFLNGTNAAQTFYISGTMRSLVFNYSGTSPTTPGYPLRVMCSGLTVSSTVSFPGGSDRPVYLFYRNSQPVSITHTSAPRLSVLLVSQTASIQSGSLRGGIVQSGGSLSVSGGTLNILRETDPGSLDEVALRRGWVESYRND